MRTLVVEDEFLSRALLTGMLSQYGGCDVAVNGQEALEAVRLALASGRPYNLICLDIMMPIMDGQEALKAIRALEKEAKITLDARSRIVMTTALDNYESISKSFWELCDGYLLKPIDMKKITALLNELKLC